RPGRSGSTNTTGSTPRCPSAVTSSPAGAASSAPPPWTCTCRPSPSTSPSERDPLPTGRNAVKTTAAVLIDAGKPFEIMELDLDGPGPGEVLIRYTAAGLCHSDLHLTDGDLPPRYPIVGGHEGAGVIEEVGPGVTKVKPGDHVVCSFIPNCGHCRYCSTGRQ